MKSRYCETVSVTQDPFLDAACHVTLEAGIIVVFLASPSSCPALKDQALHYQRCTHYLTLLSAFWDWAQGLGKRPTGALMGTMDGQFYRIKQGAKPEPLRRFPEDRPCPRAAVYCMAATDQLVVTGSDDGALRMLHMV
jgi:hypothetical protein